MMPSKHSAPHCYATLGTWKGGKVKGTREATQLETRAEFENSELLTYMSESLNAWGIPTQAMCL